MKIETISPKYFSAKLIPNTNRIETVLSMVFDSLKTSDIVEGENRKRINISIPIGQDYLSFDEHRIIIKAIKKAGWSKFTATQCYIRKLKEDKQVYLVITFYFPLSIMDRIHRMVYKIE